MEKFPQESFDVLTKKVKYLNEKDVRLDTINPNNILVENTDKEINLVDIGFNFHTKNIKPPFNGFNDIAYLLLDVNLHNVYLEKLPPYKRAEFIEVSKNLIKKLKYSADSLGLSSSINTSRQVYKEIDKDLNSELGQFGIHVNTFCFFEDFNKAYFSELI